MKTKLLLFLLFFSLIINAQTNLVPNGNFENWKSSSQPDNWFRYFSGFASESTMAQNGSSSTNMMIASGTLNFINSEYFPVVANKTYRVTLYHKLVSGSFSAIDLSLYHKPGTFKEEIIKKTDATFSSSEWRKIEFDYTPTVSENIEVDIWTTGTLNSEILVDNVSVIDVAEQNQAYTLISDVNFEKTLIAKGIDSGVTDGKVLTSNVIAVTDLFISSKSISDLTGIQDFTSLINFECDNNNLTDIDVSNNTKLKFLSVGGNQLTKLNVSKNTALTDLYFHENQISSIDVSQNTALKMLYFTKNTITNIDVTNNPILTHLYCNSNQLTTLNVSKNTALTNLTCDHNQLTNLDISNNTLLGAIDCNSNQLKSLNTSKNTVLIRIECATNQITSLDTSKNPLHILNCSSNQLTDLDLSMNTGLNFLFCNNNQLTSLNLKNGNNSSFGNMGDNFKYNPNLTCIQVDDVAFSNKNWANAKDATASYSILCENQIILIADPNFEQKLIDLGIDTDGLNGKITVDDANHVTNLDLSNSNITNLSGIENFTALTYLNCSNNQLTTLDLSQNILLETLDASSNQITSLDLSKNGKLTIVYVVSNPLLYLNLQNGNNTNMIILNVTGKNAANNITTTFLGLDKLACVKVDDAVFSNANWSKIKEESTVYSTTCTLGIEDSVFEKAVLYPNPTKGEVSINNVTLKKATVYNSLGQLVKTFTLDSINTNNTINLSGIPKGIYYVYLESEGANTAKKIIVE
jgi:Leucine-rich repeat (LRR) protein